MKKIKIKFLNFVLLLIMCLVSLFFVGCTERQEKKQDSDAPKKERLVMGLDVNLMPMGYIGEQGEIVGFDVELAQQVCNKLGKELVFKPINWDEKESELNSGNVDFIWNGLSYTKDRAEKMELSKAYMKNDQVVVFNKDLDIKSLDDLKDLTVCVQKGSTAEEFLEKNNISKNFKSLNKLADMNDCLMEVVEKSSDVAVVDEIFYKSFAKENDSENDLVVMKEPLAKEEFVIGFKKGNVELKNKFEEALQSLIDSKKAEEISQKYFGENLVFLKEVEK